MKESEETSFAKTRSTSLLLLSLPIGSFSSRGGGGMVLLFFFVGFGIDQENKSVATKKKSIPKKFPRDLWKKLCVMEVMNKTLSLLRINLQMNWGFNIINKIFLIEHWKLKRSSTGLSCYFVLIILQIEFATQIRDQKSNMSIGLRCLACLKICLLCHLSN